MEEGRIVLIGNENDILHCGYSHALSEGGKRYPSADHYAHSMILTQLGLDEVHILELLATSSRHVPIRARELLQENMPPGHDLNSLAQYLQQSRQSYTMLGLRLRAEQDKRFRQALMDTKDALLIVCDPRDSELGIGMEEEAFIEYARRRRANADTISQWMQDEKTRPPEIGQNQLGFFLMWLRFEIREKERVKWLTTTEIKIDGISLDQDDNVMPISISEFVISLQVDEADVQHKMSRMDRWRQSAMKHKIGKNDYLQQLLLSTGHAVLLETSGNLRWYITTRQLPISGYEEGEYQWCSGMDEFELQHLLTKKYITPQLLVEYMSGRTKVPMALAHIGGNKSGLLLMELRTKFASSCASRIPLVAPLSSNVLRTGVSNHMICFTPESCLHPLYPAEVRTSPDSESLPSPAHVVAQVAIKRLSIPKVEADWVMETRSSIECWERLHAVINDMMIPPEKLQTWYMTERQVALRDAMRLQFEQHPPLLRALLDTGDSLLVCCARFSSTEGELNIGMRERDLRLWCAQVRLDSKQLIDLSVRPMAFRPPYFGGNRLGLILMEIRRDFILKGVFPQQLPELPLSIDSILGSESPMENYVPHYPFDILDEGNYNAMWANPFLLMSKQDGAPSESWTSATSVKTRPIMISVEEPRLSALFEELVSLTPPTNGKTAGDVLAELPTEDLRGIYLKLMGQVRLKMQEDDEIQRQVGAYSRESVKMQELRRSLERSREQLSMREKQLGGPSTETISPWIHPPGTLNRLPAIRIPATQGSSGGDRSPTHRSRRDDYSSQGRRNPSIPPRVPEASPSSGGKIPSLLPELTTTSSADRPGRYSQSGDRERRGGMRYDGNRRSGGQQQQPYQSGRRQRQRPSVSPIRDAFGRSDGKQNGQRGTVVNETEPPPEPANVDQPPAPKKPKRVVDESELSEGEIVSDEDD
ncbi:Protein C23G10.8 [Aphelenchoides avenae]|nr:Protein C23G10.8 [Aphelenchus avenae]